MKIKLARLFVIILLSGVGSMWGASKTYAAPRMTLDPALATVQNGASVALTVTIDVESNPSLGADAVVTYASSDFDVTGVTNGGFFPDFSWANDPGNNRIEIHAGSFQTFSNKTGAGTLATITFKAKKSSGNSTIGFACGGGAPTSQIIPTNGGNILSCSSLNQSTITFGEATQPTNTPVPTATPLPTATSAPSGNNIDPVCEGLSVNKTSGTAPLTVTFSCAGADSNNDVNLAEFTFGDGQQLSIEKNVGQKGSISTNHTYTIAGSFAASCRVRDNNSSFSSRPETCRKTITVSAAGSGTSGVQRAATPIPTPIPTYGTQIVSLSTVTPTPLPDFSRPEPTPAEKEQEAYAFPWASIGVGVIILGGLFLTGWYIRKKPPMHPPTSNPPPSPFP